MPLMLLVSADRQHICNLHLVNPTGLQNSVAFVILVDVEPVSQHVEVICSSMCARRARTLWLSVGVGWKIRATWLQELDIRSGFIDFKILFTLNAVLAHNVPHRSSRLCVNHDLVIFRVDEMARDKARPVSKRVWVTWQVSQHFQKAGLGLKLGLWSQRNFDQNLATHDSFYSFNRIS